MTNEKERQKELLRKRGICVIIPTYNNGGTVADVVRRSLAECSDVIVVDDGSTDNTAGQLSLLQEKSQSASETTGLTLLHHDRNRGKGCALRTGFAKAMEMGFRYAITLDADGQHFPEDIPLFLKANQDYPGALIVGTRHIVGHASQRGNTHHIVAHASQRGNRRHIVGHASQRGSSRFANKFSNFWFYIQTGRRLPDTQTGYRLYPLTSPKQGRPGGVLGGTFTSRYEAELAMMAFASWHGTELVPIDIRVYYPPQEERVSHFRPVADFARISVLNTVLCFLAVVYGLPLRLWRWLTRMVRTVGSLLFFVFFSVFVFTPAVWLYVKFPGIRQTTERKRTNIHRLIHWIARWVMIRIGIPGAPFSYAVADPSAFDSPHVIISNHQSHLDLMCLMVFTPKIVFLTNDWVWHNPFYGFIIRQAEYYPVSEGIDTLLPRLRSLVERGYSIAVFPEGTRSPDCRIGRFHQGAFHIAQQLGLDILPACLYGPGRVLPKKAYTLRKSPIHVEVAPPVTRQEMEAMGDTLIQARTLRKRYIEWFEELASRFC